MLCKWRPSINTVMFHYAMQNKYSTFLSFCHMNCITFHVVTQIFFWLHTKNNAEPYIIKSPNLSSTRKCYNEPQGTLFSSGVPLLFLPLQSNAIVHSWPLSIDHIFKNKKPRLYVLKKTSAKLYRSSILSLGKWKCVWFIFAFYPFSFTS